MPVAMRELVPLGASALRVSPVCLGSMTWGIQNNEVEAHEQINYALSRGINFIDTAETYPIPSSYPKWNPGDTETIIGRYFANHPHRRADIVLATKVAGYRSSTRVAANRCVPPSEPPFPSTRLDAPSILAACDASLRRLQTDYIDLYQLHWPDRYVPLWSQRAYQPHNERNAVHIRETLTALKQLLDAGKIRAWGLSNETTFGVCQFVQIADELAMPRPATIQNSFCLLDRRFEAELAEACAPSNFNIGLLPWSILAGGALSGKYLGKVASDGRPVDSSLDHCRMVKFSGFMERYINGASARATAKYAALASDVGMSLATLAQAFCNSRWYIPSSIIGATNMHQLKENIDAFDVHLSEDVLRRIDEIHNDNLDASVMA
ncbi:unnamed protein product [Agarophyton chilense]